jgi:ABC-type glycerol-3-phosphate transport system permease component
LIISIVFYPNIINFFFLRKSKITIKPIIWVFIFLLSHNQVKALKVDFSSEKILKRSHELIAMGMGFDFDDKRIPHLDKNNIQKYMNNDILFFKKNIFLSQNDLNNIDIKSLESINLNLLDNFSVDLDSRKKFQKVYFNSSNIKVDKVFFTNSNGYLIGYAISNSNFKFFNNKENKFLGIVSGEEIIHNVYY